MVQIGFDQISPLASPPARFGNDIRTLQKQNVSRCQTTFVHPLMTSLIPHLPPSWHTKINLPPERQLGNCDHEREFIKNLYFPFIFLYVFTSDTVILKFIYSTLISQPLKFSIFL